MPKLSKQEMLEHFMRTKYGAIFKAPFGFTNWDFFSQVGVLSRENCKDFRDAEPNKKGEEDAE